MTEVIEEPGTDPSAQYKVQQNQNKDGGRDRVDLSIHDSLSFPVTSRL